MIQFFNVYFLRYRLTRFAQKSNDMSQNAILLIHCPDQKGLVAAVTDFLHKNNGNILDLEQHVDKANSVFLCVWSGI